MQIATKLGFVAHVVVPALLATPLVHATSMADQFTLRTSCPPGFEQTQERQCRVVTLYDRYPSQSNSGGLRASLPEARDGYTPEQIDLGRYLFFDPVLSGDRKTSCAHCHHPERGFTDGQGLGVGFGGKGSGDERAGGVLLNRGTPGLWNVVFQDRFFWDGRAQSLGEQVDGPLFSEKEMGNTPDQLLGSLNSSEIYRRLFKAAFELGHDAPISLDLIADALAAFQSSLVSLNSRYDRYAHGDPRALSAQEVEGHNLFRSFVTRCSQCHTPPLFTNNQLAVIGSPEPAGAVFDEGAFAVTGVEELRGAFKVPTLRNIAITAPYMHSGVFSSLDEVVDFYNNERGHAVPVDQSVHLHWHIAMQDKLLSKREEQALVAFLKTLTDLSMTPEIPSVVPSGLPVIQFNESAPAPSGH